MKRRHRLRVDLSPTDRARMEGARRIIEEMEAFNLAPPCAQEARQRVDVPRKRQSPGHREGNRGLKG